MKYLLIVDDEPKILTSFGRVLGYLKGREVNGRREGKIIEGIDFASDGQEAYDLIRADPEKYAVVVSDLRMPKMDGRELFERISDYDIGRVMVTGTPGDIKEPDSGVTYFIKPVEMQELKEVVVREIKKREVKEKRD